MGPGGKNPAGADPQPAGSPADQLIQALGQPSSPLHLDPTPSLLAPLAMPELLATIGVAADCGYLPQLVARSAWFGGPARPRIQAAIHAVELARGPANVGNARLDQIGRELDALPQDQLLAILEYLLHQRGAAVAAAMLLEGVLTMRAAGPEPAASAEEGAGGGSRAQSQDEASTAGAVAGVTLPSGAPGPIEPGPWTPPGRQPGGLYVGIEAHERIAREYEAAHRGDRVLSNYTPMVSVLRAMKAEKGGDALTESELLKRPDIVNLDKLHLYEIKPATAQGAGAAKAGLYLGLFGKAGIAMQLGPVGEPGTEGGLPAPNGVFIFRAVQPGVIVYEYRHGRLVPVPVPQPEGAKERRWRFELRPLTRQEQQAMATLTVGGALLLIMMILLAPVGA
jgi:hypothetical protein